jgi:hypothetical protein
VALNPCEGEAPDIVAISPTNQPPEIRLETQAGGLTGTGILLLVKISDIAESVA